VSEKVGSIKGDMLSVMNYIISSQEMRHDSDAMESSRQWSNKDMEKLRVATRDFDDIMASDGPEAFKQELIKKRIQTKPMAGPKGVLPEGSERVDSIVTDALKGMKGPDVSDAVLALKRVLGDRAYNERRGFYSFYVDQIHKMYNQQGVAEGYQLSEFGGDATQFSTPTQSTPTTEHPPRKGYSIMLTGKPGKDWMASYAWQALEKVLPRDYPGDSIAAAAHGSTLPVTRAILKVQEASKKGSAVVKTGIASEDVAETLVARLAANRIPAQFWRITSEDLDEGIQNSAPSSNIGNNEYKQWMGKIKKYYPTAKVQQRKSPPLLVIAYDKGKEVGVFDIEHRIIKFVPPNKDYWNSNDWKPGSMTGVTEGVDAAWAAAKMKHNPDDAGAIAAGRKNKSPIAIMLAQPSIANNQEMVDIMATTLGLPAGSSIQKILAADDAMNAKAGNKYSIGSETNMVEGKIDFAKKLQKNVDKNNKAVVQTKKDIGSRIADIGAGGKEYNVKTDAAWDAAKKKVAEGAKVDRFVGHVEKSEEKAGKSKKDAESIAWATANKRGMLDNKNKKK